METDGLYTTEPDKRNASVPLTIAVDITREEFVKFSQLVSRIVPRDGGRRLGAGYFMFIIAGFVFCAGMMIMEWLTYKQLDLFMVILLVMMVLSSASSLWSRAARVRIEAARDYDETRMNGQSYYGNIFVFPDRVEKHSERNNTVLRFDTAMLYLEERDMIIFIIPGQPAIVLPARCVNEEQTELLRRLIADSIPESRRKIFEMLVPRGHVPEEPVSVEDEENLPSIHIRVTYTKKEMRLMALESALKAFSARLPLFCMIAVLITLIAITAAGFGAGAATFLMTMITLLAIPVITGQLAVGNKFSAEERDEIDGFSVRVTEVSLTFRIPDRRNSQRIAWDMVTRAIERPEAVDFQFSGGMMRIPKRCMNDAMLKELREITNRKMPKK